MEDMPPQNQSDRLSIIERDIALSTQDRKQMRDDIHEIKQSVKSFDEKFDIYMEKLEIKIENQEKKFAPKENVDKLRVIVWAIIGFVFTTLGVAILDGVFK